MTTLPINYSFQETTIKGNFINIDKQRVRLLPDDIDTFIEFVDIVKKKLLFGKHKYNQLSQLSKKSLNQLFKYPLHTKNLMEYIVINTANVELEELNINTDYILKILPTHLMVRTDNSWEMVFTITKTTPSDNKYAFIKDDVKISNKENKINAYL